MTFFDNVKGGVSAAVNTLSDVAQNIVEKNRTTAKLNRLRAIMKSETDTINKAYEALGKIYYEKMTAEEVEENAMLCQIVEVGEERLKRAHTKYLQIMEEKKEDAVASATSDPADLVDITVACSNEDDYESSPFKSDEKEVATTATEEAPLSFDDVDLTVKAKEDATEETEEAAEEEIF